MNKKKKKKRVIALLAKIIFLHSSHEFKWLNLGIPSGVNLSVTPVVSFIWFSTLCSQCYAINIYQHEWSE